MLLLSLHYEYLALTARRSRFQGFPVDVCCSGDCPGAVKSVAKVVAILHLVRFGLAPSKSSTPTASVSASPPSAPSALARSVSSGAALGSLSALPRLRKHANSSCLWRLALSAAASIESAPSLSHLSRSTSTGCQRSLTALQASDRSSSCLASGANSSHPEL